MTVHYIPPNKGMPFLSSSTNDIYYYNPINNQRDWNPFNLNYNISLPNNWEIKTSSSGTNYFYQTKLGISQYKIPDGSVIDHTKYMVLAIDHDRCGAKITKETINKDAFKGLIAQISSYHVPTLILVSFSNRQTDAINALWKQGPTSLEHLQTIGQFLAEALPNMRISVNDRYFAEDIYSSLLTKDDVDKFRIEHGKTILAARIIDAYPDASHILFLDDKYELLPRHSARVAVMQFSPLIWPQVSEINKLLW